MELAPSGDAIATLREQVMLPAFGTPLGWRRLTHPNAVRRLRDRLVQLVERVFLELGSALSAFVRCTPKSTGPAPRVSPQPMQAATVASLSRIARRSSRAGLELAEKFLMRFLKPAIADKREVAKSRQAR